MKDSTTPPADVAGTIERDGGGKYTDRAEDRGGPTRWGITFDTFRRSRNDQRRIAAEVRVMERVEADGIDHRMFVVKPHFDELEPPVRQHDIDSGVVSGPRRACRGPAASPPVPWH